MKIRGIPDDLPTLVIRVPQFPYLPPPPPPPPPPDFPSWTIFPPPNDNDPGSGSGSGSGGGTIFGYVLLSVVIIIVLAVLLSFPPLRRLFTALFNRDNYPSFPSRGGPRNIPNITGMSTAPSTRPYPDPRLTGFPSRRLITALFNKDNYPSFPSRGGPRNFPNITGMSIAPSTRPRPDPRLRGFPTAYLGQPGRRIRATDILRPGGPPVVDRTTKLDRDGVLGDKDILSAYHSFGGPPKYQVRRFAVANLVVPCRKYGRSDCRSVCYPVSGNSADMDRPDASREASSSPESLPSSLSSTRDMVRGAT